MERLERRTTFVKHVAESSTTRDDISLGDERKAVPACHPNPVVLALSGRHDERVSDVIDCNDGSPEIAGSIYHSLTRVATSYSIFPWLFQRYVLSSVLSNLPLPISTLTRLQRIIKVRASRTPFFVLRHPFPTIIGNGAPCGRPCTRNIRRST